VLQATGPGWALVGDAAYHRDPISGHGITDAFRDAELAAYELGRHLDGEVAEATALTAYDHTRLQALRPIFDVTTALGAFPAVDEFVCWQRRYAELVDAEADWLAARPTIPDRDRLVAA
jgi:2-polyprenyl-6-methoxyphenol hydroxylase-like FAD-dependent oxidoreductase